MDLAAGGSTVIDMGSYDTSRVKGIAVLHDCQSSESDSYIVDSIACVNGNTLLHFSR